MSGEQSSELSDFAFTLEIPTRWSDLDALGHVNNTRFLSFDESARLAYLGELTAPDAGKGANQGPILARIACDFRSQLHHPSLVTAGIRIARIGRSSLATLGAMFVDGRCIAQTQGVLVWFDYAAQQSCPVPDALRQRITARERIAPDIATA